MKKVMESCAPTAAALEAEIRMESIQNSRLQYKRRFSVESNESRNRRVTLERSDPGQVISERLPNGLAGECGA